MDADLPAQLEIARLRKALSASQALLDRQRADTQHRVRNLLAVVRAISRLSIEQATSLEQLAMHQGDRIAALARVEEALDASAGVGVDLEHLLWNEWLVVLSPSEEWRARVKGQPVFLSQKAAEQIGLACHELTTNALKFGALSSPRGRIEVEWEIGPDRVDMVWRETGVSLIDTSPKRVGFGRKLIERGLPYDLGATTTLRFAPGGLECVICLPIDANVLPSHACDDRLSEEP